MIYNPNNGHYIARGGIALPPPEPVRAEQQDNDEEDFKPEYYYTEQQGSDEYDLNYHKDYSDVRTQRKTSTGKGFKKFWSKLTAFFASAKRQQRPSGTNIQSSYSVSKKEHKGFKKFHVCEEPAVPFAPSHITNNIRRADSVSSSDHHHRDWAINAQATRRNEVTFVEYEQTSQLTAPSEHHEDDDEHEMIKETVQKPGPFIGQNNQPDDEHEESQVSPESPTRLLLDQAYNAEWAQTLPHRHSMEGYEQQNTKKPIFESPVSVTDRFIASPNESDDRTVNQRSPNRPFSADTKATHFSLLYSLYPAESIVFDYADQDNQSLLEHSNATRALKTQSSSQQQLAGLTDALKTFEHSVSPVVMIDRENQQSIAAPKAIRSSPRKPLPRTPGWNAVLEQVVPRETVASLELKKELDHTIVKSFPTPEPSTIGVASPMMVEEPLAEAKKRVSGVNPPMSHDLLSPQPSSPSSNIDMGDILDHPVTPDDSVSSVGLRNMESWPARPDGYPSNLGAKNGGFKKANHPGSRLSWMQHNRFNANRREGRILGPDRRSSRNHSMLVINTQPIKPISDNDSMVSVLDSYLSVLSIDESAPIAQRQLHLASTVDSRFSVKRQPTNQSTDTAGNELLEIMDAAPTAPKMVRKFTHGRHLSLDSVIPPFVDVTQTQTVDSVESPEFHLISRHNSTRRVMTKKHPNSVIVVSSPTSARGLSPAMIVFDDLLSQLDYGIAASAASRDSANKRNSF